MFSLLCLLKILFSLCWIEQRMDGVRCVVFCTTSPCGVVLIYSYGFYTLGPGFAPRAFAYFTVNLIVSISLCSILPYNLITNRKKFVVELKVYLSLEYCYICSILSR
jgi:hypothetical protein